ncbi:MAG: hypothetical protein ACRC5W_09330 [Cetobacterium sp.]
MEMLEKDKFCREKIRIENIEHRLYQIARKGKYFLKDIVLVKNIDILKCSFDEYHILLKKYGIEAEIDDYNLGWTTIIQGYNILDEYSYILTKYTVSWDIKFLVGLKRSIHEENCGWELYIEDLETNFHTWVYAQLEKNDLEICQNYTISVDNLDVPKEIYIYTNNKQILIIEYVD